VPVFIEAPLVRSLPLLSLAMTGLWVGLSFANVSNIHPPLGRSVAGVQLELVGGITLLGLAALGTVVTFAGRSDRSTVCFGVPEAKLG